MILPPFVITLEPPSRRFFVVLKQSVLIGGSSPTSCAMAP